MLVTAAKSSDGMFYISSNQCRNTSRRGGARKAKSERSALKVAQSKQFTDGSSTASDISRKEEQWAKCTVSSDCSQPTENSTTASSYAPSHTSFEDDDAVLDANFVEKPPAFYTTNCCFGFAQNDETSHANSSYTSASNFVSTSSSDDRDSSNEDVTTTSDEQDSAYDNNSDPNGSALEGACWKRTYVQL